MADGSPRPGAVMRSPGTPKALGATAASTAAATRTATSSASTLMDNPAFSFRPDEFPELAENFRNAELRVAAISARRNDEL